jgi:hypothetical protein
MTERSQEQGLPVWLGSAVVRRTVQGEGPRAGSTVNVEVHVYRFNRPKRFPLTRNLLLKLIDTRWNLTIDTPQAKGIRVA